MIATPSPEPGLPSDRPIPRPIRLPGDVQRVYTALKSLLGTWGAEPVRAVAAATAWNGFRRAFIDPHAAGGEVRCSVDANGLPDLDGLPQLVRASSALNSMGRAALEALIYAGQRSCAGAMWFSDDTEATYRARLQYGPTTEPIRRMLAAIWIALRELEPLAGAPPAGPVAGGTAERKGDSPAGNRRGRKADPSDAVLDEKARRLWDTGGWHGNREDLAAHLGINLEQLRDSLERSRKKRDREAKRRKNPTRNNSAR